MPIPQPTLHFGSRGQAVEHLQAILNAVPPTALARLVHDGIFGTRTSARVIEFQRQNKLVADAIVGPATWAQLLSLFTQLKSDDPEDTNYKLPQPVTLRFATVYLPTFLGDSTIAALNFRKATSFLKRHNLFIEVWPQEGIRRVENMITDKYFDPIPSGEVSFSKQLRKDIDDFLYAARGYNRNNGPMPIVFCDFTGRGHAVTVPSTARIPWANPLALVRISALSVSDHLCILHEAGHSALHPHQKHNSDPLNLMSDRTDSRDNIKRFQVEALAKASFARPGMPK